MATDRRALFQRVFFMSPVKISVGKRIISSGRRRFLIRVERKVISAESVFIVTEATMFSWRVGENMNSR